MGSAFENAITAGLKMSRRVAGVSVTVTRGVTTITVDKAIQGQTQKRPLQENSETTVDSADWFISVAEYTLGTPAVGDIITRVIDGTSYVYTVETPDYGMQCWDWSDTAKTQYRIHSRKDGGSAFDVSKPNGFDLSGTEMRYT
jgi:hypothetical protein